MSSSFAYKVRDPLGNVHEGSVDAGSVDDAKQQLRKSGFLVMDVEEESLNLGSLTAKRISKTDIVYVTNQLAVMVDTGITISSALDAIAQQEANPKLREMLTELKLTVESGESFSTALSQYPKHFDETYVALIRASEATGSLGEMLDQIADYLSKELETHSKVRSAMAYPAVMLFIAIGVTVFLLTFVMPKFEPMFNRPGVELPTSTIVMMYTSEAMINYWYFWIAGLVALIVGFLTMQRTSVGRQAIDYAKIYAPVIGQLFRKVVISRSVRTLGAMVDSGVSMLDALQLTADVSGNFYYRRLWLEVRERVTTGSRICEALAGEPLLPPMLIQMISSGEDTGKLNEVLQRVSSYYDKEVDATVKTTTTLIEPVMITTMGVVVGTIAMSLLLPIFSLSKPPG